MRAQTKHAPACVEHDDASCGGWKVGVLREGVEYVSVLINPVEHGRRRQSQRANPGLTESIFPGLISRRRNYSVKMRIGHQRGIQCMDKGNKAARQKAMQVHDMRHACLRMPPGCHHRDSGNRNVGAQKKNIGTRTTNMPCTYQEQTIKNTTSKGKHKDTHWEP